MPATAGPRGALGWRKLERADLPLLGRWLAEPLVRRWWAHDPSPAAVAHDFGPSIDGEDVTELLVALLDGLPVGLLQRYPIAAYPEYVEELSPLLTVPAGALSLDYLIAEPAARSRGVGTRMIAAAVLDGWDRYPDAHDVLVPVHRDNRSSWRALERAGFTRVAEGQLAPDNPADSRDHVVYALGRPTG